MFWSILFLSLLLPKSVSAAINDVIITNFSSNTLPEWVEIQNQTDNIIDLTGWKLQDASQTNLSISGCLSAHSYLTVYQTHSWLNNDGDIISLYDNNNQLINQLTYTTGKIETSPKSDNTCTPSITPSPTPSPTAAPLPSITSSPTPNPTNTPVPTATNTPTPLSTSTVVPTKIPTNTPFPTVTPDPIPSYDPLPTDDPSAPILGIEDIVTPTPLLTSKTSQSSGFVSLIPVIFVILGMVLLLVPLIVTKFKAHAHHL